MATTASAPATTSTRTPRSRAASSTRREHASGVSGPPADASENPEQQLAQARARHRALLALEFPGLDSFDEPALEWRRLFGELFGTLLLVLAGAGGPVVDAVSRGAISRQAAVAAPGLMVMAAILFMGAVSGAHLNPAVTLAFGLRRDFPWRRVPGYLVAQFAGATLACLFLWAVFGKVGALGATVPGRGFTTGKPC